MRLGVPALLSAAAVLFLALVPASAAVQSVNVAGDVVGSCTTVSGGSAIPFGNYDPFTYPAGTPLYDNTPLTLSTNCTLGDSVSWTIGDGGNCNKGLASDRAMSDGASHYLSYELYKATNGAGGSWATNNCGAPDPASQNGGGTAGVNSVTLYGAIPGGQNVPVGTYNDSIVVTLSY